eukprot:gb/GECH01014127.1/.p1 GENE.gb/GECH01014127.1/~~gb/GECH01014127.1/.p1  ORF type:complete len:517 (+),score=118.59 gb/GECH01014127.1/:1-1551(+)
MNPFRRKRNKQKKDDRSSSLSSLSDSSSRNDLDNDRDMMNNDYYSHYVNDGNSRMQSVEEDDDDENFSPALSHPLSSYNRRRQRKEEQVASDDSDSDYEGLFVGDSDESKESSVVYSAAGEQSSGHHHDYNYNNAHDYDIYGDGGDASIETSNKGWDENDMDTLPESSSIARTLSLTGISEITYGRSAKGPKMVNQYMLGEQLGEGAYGKVREAIDSKTLRRVAVKIIKMKKLHKIRHGEESIRNEIAIMRKLNHPNVIQLYEVIHQEEFGKMYMVIEFAGGGSLQQLIDSHPDKRLALDQVKSFFCQLINGLEYLHNQGIVHRDIKPDNLMITPDGVLKISDFGVAQQLNKFDNSDILSQGLGSPAFQSPQIAAGIKEFSGFKLDVWATGVTLYLLVTGDFPFGGNTVANLYDNIKAGDFTIPDWIQEPLRSLISGMLEMDENERLSVRDIKEHPWLKDTVCDPVPCAPEELQRRSSWRSFTLLPYVAKAVGSDAMAFGPRSGGPSTGHKRCVIS